jgi:hypothetical protein
MDELDENLCLNHFKFLFLLKWTKSAHVIKSL